MKKTLELKVLRNLDMVRLVREAVMKEGLKAQVKLDWEYKLVIICVEGASKNQAEFLKCYTRGINDAYFMLAARTRCP